MDALKFLLNVIWLVFGGLLLALGYAVAGVICCALIVTIPFGIASLRIARYALWPFGHTTEPNPGTGLPSVLGNVVWVVFAGWWLALGHIVSGVAMCLTIIGIPLGIANFKMVPISLLPLGYRIVPTERGLPVRAADAPVEADLGRSGARW